MLPLGHMEFLLLALTQMSALFHVQIQADIRQCQLVRAQNYTS